MMRIKVRTSMIMSIYWRSGARLEDENGSPAAWSGVVSGRCAIKSWGETLPQVIEAFNCI